MFITRYQRLKQNKKTSDQFQNNVIAKVRRIANFTNASASVSGVATGGGGGNPPFLGKMGPHFF